MSSINCVARVGYSISSTLPSKFNADLDVVGCYIYYSDKILLLQVCPKKDEASLWGVPAGKIEKNEQPTLAAVRELHEETKIIVESNQVECFGKLYITKPSFSFTYTMFNVLIKEKAPVLISAEHQAYKWVSIRDAFNLPLIYGAREGLVVYEQYQKNVHA